MANGWVKLHRETLDKNIFKDAYTFQVFTYLMLKAAYKDMSIKVGNRNIELAPGQLLYGRKSVSEKLGMGEGKLRGIMKYLVQSGSIAIEAHSRYSIVTILSWNKSQHGDAAPEFPFDIDFLDDADGNEDGYTETEPAENQMQMQAQPGFENCDDEFLTSREPQYNKYKNNKINNNKTIKNKTKENNKKQENKKHLENPENIQNIANIQTSKNMKNLQNMKNIQTRSYRQNPNSSDEAARFAAPGILPKVVGLDTSQEMLYSGGGISKGKVCTVASANRYSAAPSSGAFAAPSRRPAAAASCFDDDDAIDVHLLFDVDF